MLLAVGVIGFAIDSSFDTGSGVQGDELIVFEVNGWHNLVHIASGALGLAAGFASSREPSSPRAGVSAPTTR